MWSTLIFVLLTLIGGVKSQTQWNKPASNSRDIENLDLFEIASRRNITREQIISRYPRLNGNLVRFLNKGLFTDLEICYNIRYSDTLEYIFKNLTFVEENSNQFVDALLQNLRALFKENVDPYFPIEYKKPMSHFCPNYIQMLSDLYEDVFLPPILSKLQVTKDDFMKYANKTQSAGYMKNYIIAYWRLDQNRINDARKKTEAEFIQLLKKIDINQGNANYTIGKVIADRLDVPQTMVFHVMGSFIGALSNVIKIVFSMSIKDVLMGIGKDLNEISTAYTYHTSFASKGFAMSTQISLPLALFMKDALQKDGINAIKTNSMMSMATKAWNTTETFITNWFQLNATSISLMKNYTVEEIVTKRLNFQNFKDEYYYCIYAQTFVDETSIQMLTTGLQYNREKYLNDSIMQGCLDIVRTAKFSDLEKIFNFSAASSKETISQFLRKRLLFTKEKIDAVFGITASNIFDVISFKPWKNQGLNTLTIWSAVIAWNQTTANQELHERLRPRVTMEDSNSTIADIATRKLYLNTNELIAIETVLNFPMSLREFSVAATLNSVMHCFSVTLDDTILSVLLKVSYLDDNEDSLVKSTLSRMEQNGFNISSYTSMKVHTVCTMFLTTILDNYYETYLNLQAQNFKVSKDEMLSLLQVLDIKDIYKNMYKAQMLADEEMMTMEMYKLQGAVLKVLNKVSVSNITDATESQKKQMSAFQIMARTLNVSGFNPKMFEGVLNPAVLFYFNLTSDVVHKEFFNQSNIDYNTFSTYPLSQWVMLIGQFSTFVENQLKIPVTYAMHVVLVKPDDIHKYSLTDLVSKATENRGQTYVMSKFQNVMQAYMLKNISAIASSQPGWSQMQLLVFPLNFLAQFNMKTNKEIQDAYLHAVQYAKNQTFKMINDVSEIPYDETIEKTHYTLFGMSMDMFKTLFTYNRSECEFDHYRGKGYRNASMMYGENNTLHKLDEIIVKMNTPDSLPSQTSLPLHIGDNDILINKVKPMNIKMESIICKYPSLKMHLRFLEQYPFHMLRTCYGVKGDMDITTMIQEIIKKEMNPATAISKMLLTIRMIDNVLVSNVFPSNQNMSISHFCPMFYNMTSNMYGKILMARLNTAKVSMDDMNKVIMKVNVEEEVKMFALATVRNDAEMVKKAKNAFQYKMAMYGINILITEATYNKTVNQVISNNFNVSIGTVKFLMDEFGLFSKEVNSIFENVHIKEIIQSVQGLQTSPVVSLFNSILSKFQPLESKMNLPIIKLSCMLNNCGIKNMKILNLMMAVRELTDMAKESVVKAWLQLDDETFNVMKSNTFQSRISSLQKDIPETMYQYFTISNIIGKESFDKMKPISQTANRYIKSIFFKGVSQFIYIHPIKDLLKYYDVIEDDRYKNCSHILEKYGGMNEDILRYFITNAFMDVLKKQSCSTLTSLNGVTDSMTLVQACDAWNQQGECPTICPTVFSPVCGSDGKTYDNECRLRIENCKTNVTVISQGSCENKTGNALTVKLNDIVKSFDQFYGSTIFQIAEKYTSVSTSSLIATYKIGASLKTYLQATNFTMLQACYSVYIEMSMNDILIRILLLEQYSTNYINGKLSALRSVDKNCVDAYFVYGYNRTVHEFCPVYHRMVYNMFDPFLLMVGLKSINVDRSDYYRLEALLNARELYHEYTAARWRGDFYTSITYGIKLKKRIEEHAASIKITNANKDKTFFYLMTNNSAINEKVIAYSMTDNAGFPQAIHRIGKLTLQELADGIKEEISTIRNVGELLEKVIKKGNMLSTETPYPICVVGKKGTIGQNELFSKTIMYVAKQSWNVTEKFFNTWMDVSEASLERMTKRNISSLLMELKGINSTQWCFVSGFSLADDATYTRLSSGLMCDREKTSKTVVSHGIEFYIKKLRMSEAVQTMRHAQMNLSIAQYLHSAAGITIMNLNEIYESDVISLLQGISFEHVGADHSMTVHEMVQSWKKNFPEDKRWFTSLEEFKKHYANVPSLVLKQLFQMSQINNFAQIMEKSKLNNNVINFISDETIHNLHWCYGINNQDSFFSAIMKIKFLDNNKPQFRLRKVSEFLKNDITLQNQLKMMPLHQSCVFVKNSIRQFFSDTRILTAIAAEFKMTLNELMQVVGAMKIEQEYLNVTITDALDDKWGGEMAKAALIEKLVKFVSSISARNVSGSVQEKKSFTPYKVIELQTNVNASIFERDFIYESEFSFDPLFLHYFKKPLYTIYDDLKMKSTMSFEMFVNFDLSYLNKTIQAHEQMVTKQLNMPVILALQNENHQWNDIYYDKSLYELIMMFSNSRKGFLESYFEIHHYNITELKNITMNKLLVNGKISINKMKFLSVHTLIKNKDFHVKFLDYVRYFKRTVNVKQVNMMFNISREATMIESHQLVFDMNYEETYLLFSCNTSKIIFDFHGKTKVKDIVKNEDETLHDLDMNAFKESKQDELSEDRKKKVSQLLSEKMIDIEDIQDEKALQVIQTLYGAKKSQLQFYYNMIGELGEFLEKNIFSRVAVCFNLNVEMTLEQIMNQINMLETKGSRLRISALLKPFREMNMTFVDSYFGQNYTEPISLFCEKFMNMTEAMYDPLIIDWKIRMLKSTKLDFWKLVRNVKIENEMKHLLLAELRNDVLSSNIIPNSMKEKFSEFGGNISVSENDKNKTLFKVLSENMEGTSENLIKKILIESAKFNSYYGTVSNLTIAEIIKNLPNKYTYENVTFIYETLDHVVEEKIKLSKRPLILSGPEGNYYGIDAISHLNLMTLLTHTLHVTEMFFITAFEIEDYFVPYIRQLTAEKAINLLDIKERKERYQYLSADDIFNKNKRGLLDPNIASYFVRTQYAIKLTYLGMWEVMKNIKVNEYPKIYNLTDIISTDKKCFKVLKDHVGFEENDMQVFFTNNFMTICKEYSFTAMLNKYANLVNAEMPLHQIDNILSKVSLPSCGVCSKIYMPVCGSNGKTYNSYCELQRENCFTGMNVKLYYNGTCSGYKFFVNLQLIALPHYCNMTMEKLYSEEISKISMECAKANITSVITDGTKYLARKDTTLKSIQMKLLEYGLTLESMMYLNLLQISTIFFDKDTLDFMKPLSQLLSDSFDKSTISNMNIVQILATNSKWNDETKLKNRLTSWLGHDKYMMKLSGINLSNNRISENKIIDTLRHLNVIADPNFNVFITFNYASGNSLCQMPLRNNATLEMIGTACDLESNFNKNFQKINLKLTINNIGVLTDRTDVRMFDYVTLNIITGMAINKLYLLGSGPLVLAARDSGTNLSDIPRQTLKQLSFKIYKMQDEEVLAKLFEVSKENLEQAESYTLEQLATIVPNAGNVKRLYTVSLTSIILVAVGKKNASEVEREEVPKFINTLLGMKFSRLAFIYEIMDYESFGNENAVSLTSNLFGINENEFNEIIAQKLNVSTSIVKTRTFNQLFKLMNAFAFKSMFKDSTPGNLLGMFLLIHIDSQNFLLSTISQAATQLKNPKYGLINEFMSVENIENFFNSPMGIHFKAALERRHHYLLITPRLSAELGHVNITELAMKKGWDVNEYATNTTMCDLIAFHVPEWLNFKQWLNTFVNKWHDQSYLDKSFEDLFNILRFPKLIYNKDYFNINSKHMDYVKGLSPNEFVRDFRRREVYHMTTKAFITRMSDVITDITKRFETYEIITLVVRSTTYPINVAQNWNISSLIDKTFMVDPEVLFFKLKQVENADRNVVNNILKLRLQNIRTFTWNNQSALQLDHAECSYLFTLKNIMYYFNKSITNQEIMNQHLTSAKKIIESKSVTDISIMYNILKGTMKQHSGLFISKNLLCMSKQNILNESGISDIQYSYLERFTIEELQYFESNQNPIFIVKFKKYLEVYGKNANIKFFASTLAEVKQSIVSSTFEQQPLITSLIKHNSLPSNSKVFAILNSFFSKFESGYAPPDSFKVNEFQNVLTQLTYQDYASDLLLQSTSVDGRTVKEFLKLLFKNLDRCSTDHSVSCPTTRRCLNTDYGFACSSCQSGSFFNTRTQDCDFDECSTDNPNKPDTCNTVKRKYFKVKKLRMLIDFVNDLLDKKSQAFKTLAAKVAGTILKALRSKCSVCISVIINAFTRGSVLADFTVVTDGTNSTNAEVLSSVNTTVQSGGLAALQVDPSSPITSEESNICESNLNTCGNTSTCVAQTDNNNFVCECASGYEYKNNDCVAKDDDDDDHLGVKIAAPILVICLLIFIALVIYFKKRGLERGPSSFKIGNSMSNPTFLDAAGNDYAELKVVESVDDNYHKGEQNKGYDY